MFDFEPVQQLGFKNVFQNGKATGFQIRQKLPYYRGIWLSMSKGWSVMVDGELFPREAITVTLHGKTYTQDEAQKAIDVHWGKLDVLTINVAKPGGLKMGMHQVTVNWMQRVSYSAPNDEPKITPAADPNKPRRMSEFGNGNSTVDLVMLTEERG
ncbi:MAG: hypothetical protein IT169_05960 [Bryobacterales bacterium]|nr:hypothetical protein [Bryobacterales bacterium]